MDTTVINALKELRNYFGKHNKTMAEHAMYAIADNALKNIEHQSPIPPAGAEEVVKTAEEILYENIAKPIDGKPIQIDLTDVLMAMEEYASQFRTPAVVDVGASAEEVLDKHLNIKVRMPGSFWHNLRDIKPFIVDAMHEFRTPAPEGERVTVVTNQQLWDMADRIVQCQKAANDSPSNKIIWSMLNEDWFDWLNNILFGDQSMLTDGKTAPTTPAPADSVEEWTKIYDKWVLSYEDRKYMTKDLFLLAAQELLSGYQHKPKDEWVRIEDGLPEVGEYVLVICNTDVVMKGIL